MLKILLGIKLNRTLNNNNDRADRKNTLNNKACTDLLKYKMINNLW